MTPGRRPGRARLTAAIVRRELVALWATPLPYVAGAAFHVALGLLAVDTMQARQHAVFQPIVPIAGFLVLVLVPVFAMRSVADDRRRGTLDLLLAVPAPAGPIVAGKWIAIVATTATVVSPVVLHAVLLEWWGDPDRGPLVGGLAGLGLLVLAATSVALAASASTSNPAIAAVVAEFVLLLGWFLRPDADAVALRTVLARVSLNERLRTFAAGGIDLGDASFFLAVAVAGAAGAVVLVAVRRRRPPRATAALGVLAVVLVVVGQSALDERRRVVDLTAASSLTLTDATGAVLDDVDAAGIDVEITAFLRSDAPGRTEAAALLDRYEAATDRVRGSVVAPETAPGRIRALGVDPTFGGVALDAGDRLEIVPSATEQDLTLGLARLVRGDLPEVCLASGHGELDPESTLGNGFARGAAALVAHGYEVTAVDLLAGASLDGCGATLLVAPVSPLGTAVDLLADHLAAGGRVGVFLEPGFDAGLGGLLADAGVALLDGVVVEGDPESVFSGDPTAPLIRRYSSANPIVRNLPPTFLVTAGGLDVRDGDVPGRTVSRLMDTSPAAVLAVPDGDPTPGPVTVGVASDTSANVAGRIVRSRLAVIADGDVVSNAFVGEAANASLLVRVVDWLTVDDDLVTVSPNLDRVRPLELTDGRRDYARLLTAGLVPAAFLLAGGFCWAFRRSR